MFWLKWWRFLRSLGLEFWLPLPLLGLGFWLVGGFLTEYNLELSELSVEPYSIVRDRVVPSSSILFIKVTIDRKRDLSYVRVKRATQVYQKQEFKLATTKFSAIETAIASKLELPPENVRQLLRYQIE